MSLQERWTSALDSLRSQGRFRSFAVPRGLDFTSNDYLGYGNGRLTPNHTKPPLSRSGIASRLLRGNHEIWERVEAALKKWHGAEAALMLNSGFTANEGLISTIMEPGDWVATDELNHACIVDGLRLARVRRYLFRHNDLAHLEQGLQAEAEKRQEGREMFIITESLFSMDGDRANLPRIVELAEKYGAHVIVDEAHSTGCFGPEGSGLVDEAGLRSRVLASVHTGGKALGVMGAYVCGSQLLKEYLTNKCRHLIFTTALPPELGQWWLDALDCVRQDSIGRTHLQKVTQVFRTELERLGVPTLGDRYIVPVVLGDDPKAVAAAQALQSKGYDIRAIRPPSVAPGTARLRISIHADHEVPVIQQLATDVASVFHQSAKSI